MRTVLHVGATFDDVERIRKHYIDIYENLDVNFNAWYDRIEIPSEDKCIKFTSVDSLNTIRGYKPTDIIIDDYVNMIGLPFPILSRHNLIDINEDGSLK